MHLLYHIPCYILYPEYLYPAEKKFFLYWISYCGCSLEFAIFTAFWWTRAKTVKIVTRLQMDNNITRRKLALYLGLNLITHSMSHGKIHIFLQHQMHINLSITA